jgi:hypothetical protein
MIGQIMSHLTMLALENSACGAADAGLWSMTEFVGGDETLR